MQYQRLKWCDVPPRDIEELLCQNNVLLSSSGLAGSRDLISLHQPASCPQMKHGISQQQPPCPWK